MGKNVLITGASSGIGAALARRLGRDGGTVVLVARRGDALETVARDVPGARIEVLDVADADATAALVRRVDEELGGLDVVVANAGRGGLEWSGALRWEACAPMIAVNVTGAIATLTAVLPRMVARGSGHVVGVTSMAGLRGLPHNAVYGGSKAMLRTFLESLRVDLGGTGVAVTEVRPGFVRTAMTDAVDSPKPFMIDADEAADRIARGIARREAVVAFPRPTAALVRAVTLLPAGVYERAARMVRPARQGH